MISSIATQFWFQSGCKLGEEVSSKSQVYFGLFAGKTSLSKLSSTQYYTKIVCDGGDCMFSCARTADLRREHLKRVKEGTADGFVSVNCDVIGGDSNRALRAQVPAAAALPLMTLSGRALEEGEESDLLASESGSSSTTQEVPTSPEFMSYGLWVGTISCLAIGMVFAVVGALFAVINTATTPVEFITGVPGLYIWNSMAALFNLICVILWAVQFHQHLTKNVLLYDADAGWTTKGMEVFGYSYWLVVVAIIVHIANIVIIFVGTYERKAKEEVRKPEEKSVNLMLY